MTPRATRTAALIAVSALICAALAAQNGDQDDLASKSLPLRTALHHDPTLAAPLERLLALYREADRVDELLGMYRAHLAAYPADQRALVVLVRLLHATGSPEAAGAARSAAARHPENSYLHYLLYKVLNANHDPDALDELDRAIEHEALFSRRRTWITELVPAAINADRRDLAEKNLKTLAEIAGNSPEALLDASRIMLKHKFHELALVALEAAAKASPAPEVGVEIELTAASAEVGLGRAETAAGRLDRLLDRLTADYWRRPEIMHRRIALIQSGAEREAMVDAARKRAEAAPHDEAAALDLAQLLAGFDRRRSALEFLLEAGKRLPASTRIEKETLGLLDRLRDERGREAYLNERIKAHPERKDLALDHIKSLFLLGRKKEAEQELDGLVANLEPAERIRHLLDTARYLRRASLPSDAAVIFEKVVDADPARLDIRRELAETLLVLGKRQRARELFAADLPEDIQLENLLDMVQFMVKEELLLQARKTLLARLDQFPANLDLRMLLLNIEGRTGNRLRGNELIENTRGLADTGARYRLWLESSAAFHEIFETADVFLDEELSRLDLEAGEWTPNRLERRLAFAEVASRCGLKSEVAAMLQNDIDGGAPADVCAKLRRHLIRILEENVARADALKEHLEALAKDDPSCVHECNARLATLYARENRHDLANQLLEGLDIRALRDPALLGELERLYTQSSHHGRAMDVLERITVLEPTNRSAWERWVSCLARTGNELELRGALRRLLAGVERMPILEETRLLLKGHLVDSYWRSLAEHLADDQPASLAEALSLLDAAERTVCDRGQWLWVTWSRSHVLNRLDRTEERDEAIAEMLRVAGETSLSQADADKNEEKETLPARIAFPDGLSVSLAHARRLLSSQPEKKTPPVAESRRGPLPELRVKWAFDTVPASPVSAVLPCGKDRILICDVSGGIYCLDRRTGKLLWEDTDAMPSVSSGTQYQRLPYRRYRRTVTVQTRPPVPLVDEEGRIFVPGTGQVECLSIEDGRLVWRTETSDSGKAATPSTRPPVSIFFSGGGLLAFDPSSGVLASIDRATGKLVSESQLWPPEIEKVCPLNSGAAVCQGRLLVYGSKAAVLNADTGEIEWSFDPAPVREFPVRLDEPQTSLAPPVAAAPVSYSAPYPVAISSVMMPRYGGIPYHLTQPPPLQLLSHFQTQQAGPGYSGAPYHGSNRTALVAPAVQWAGNACSLTPRLGIIHENSLLLFDPGRLLCLRLDLPLAGRQSNVSGTYVGISGRTVCMLSNQTLAFIDPATGNIRTCNLPETTGGNAGARLQAAIDGPLVYVTGPRGILCINARTNQRVFFSAWPEIIAPPGETPPAQQSANYNLHGTCISVGGQQGPCIPLVERVEDGVLFATPEPFRVVALEETD